MAIFLKFQRLDSQHDVIFEAADTLLKNLIFGTWTWKIKHLKMYLLSKRHKHDDFLASHVSLFLGPCFSSLSRYLLSRAASQTSQVCESSLPYPPDLSSWSRSSSNLLPPLKKGNETNKPNPCNILDYFWMIHFLNCCTTKTQVTWANKNYVCCRCLKRWLIDVHGLWNYSWYNLGWYLNNPLYELSVLIRFLFTALMDFHATPHPPIQTNGLDKQRYSGKNAHERNIF